MRIPLSNATWFRPVANIAWLVLLMQVSTVYMVAGLAKVRGESWLAGEGVLRSLASVQFQTHPGLNHLMLEFSWILLPASIITVMLQIYFPFLVFNRWTRVPTLVLMVSFHAAIGLVMGLTSFAIVMIASEMAFVPDRVVHRARTRASRMEMPPVPRREPEPAEADT